MYFPNKITILFLISILSSGCDQAFNMAGSEYLKISLKSTCGESAPACMAAVDEQFNPCHRKHEEDWNRYMNSGLENEDELLKIYSENMYACIIDEDGAPYFVFDPE